MAHDENVETVRALYDAFRRRDIDAALRLVHPDVRLVFESTASLMERGEPYFGHEGVRRYFADIDGAWRRIDLFPDDYRAVAESVVVFGRVSALSHSGERHETLVTWVWKLRAGLAISGRVFTSRAAAERFAEHDRG